MLTSERSEELPVLYRKTFTSVHWTTGVTLKGQRLSAGHSLSAVGGTTAAGLHVKPPLTFNLILSQ